MGPAIMDAEAILKQRGCGVQDETTLLHCPSARVQFQGSVDEIVLHGAKSEEFDASRMGDASVNLAGQPLEIQPHVSFNPVHPDEGLDIYNISGEDS